MAVLFLIKIAMKKITLLLLFLLSLNFYGQQTVTYNIAPNPFEETTPITITINGSSLNEATWGITDHSIYMWAWSFDSNDTTIMDCPTNGSWTASNEANKFTYDAGSDTYTKTFVPTTFYNRTAIGRIGFLVKAKDGSGNKQSQDILAEVGSFQVTLTAPVQNSATILTSGSNLSIAATNTNGLASYVLKSNEATINSNPSTASYSFLASSITSNQNYSLEVTQGTTTISKNFSVIINPGAVTMTMPAGLLDGINYNTNDATKATLVLDAPYKDFVYVAGSFNNWQPTSGYAMKKDPTTGKFWLELTNLVSGASNSYQYWVVDETPIAGTPTLVKTADPFSTLVLSPFDDGGIPAISYPNMPTYPAGQEREVTVLQTGQTPYPWQVTNFIKPAKEKLVVYEVLVRDFDAKRNFQSLIDRMDYFKKLKINAIELLPVMEFEGNESWGYNTAFHLALDKFYGTGDKLKEFIDLCHQNGIAVILDVALNHAFGRNPMVRMWMNDPDGNGWGSPSTENPYFNTVAKHSYSVGEDLNHSSPFTQNYVKRVIKQWVEEFKIDGLRWDLTKGFTQNCTASNSSCTDGYQADRVAVLKTYADYSWSLDPTHYTIFEHLGNYTEEQEWANYKIAENPSKGIMLWGKMTNDYNNLSKGFAGNIYGMTGSSRGFTANRLMGFAESHDEERLMYNNLQTGNNSNPAHNVRDLNTALSRMSAIGAVSLLIPGPKMIWHFGELGHELSINTCTDGSVSGTCKLATKPQPQWGWVGTGATARDKIYNDWAKMITMKTTEPVFLGAATVIGSSTLYQTIKITNPALAATDLKDVLILANFDVTTQNIATGFPYAGTWTNLMDNTTINVTNVADVISIPAGEFRIYGNKAAVLAIDSFESNNKILLYPNPDPNYFTLNAKVSQVQIYSALGQLVKSFDDNQTPDYKYQVSDLSNGIYFVKATDENNHSQTLQFIKE
jgi:Alpha amylase, catalytic domain/Secretion system C-terminal sorting domain